MSTTKTITEVRGPLHNPCHPGEIIAEECLKPLALSVTDAAAALGVSRKQLSAIVNGRAGITAPMAMRLAKAFGSTAEFWLRLQMQRDLWDARQTRLARVKRLVARRRTQGGMVPDAPEATEAPDTPTTPAHGGRPRGHAAGARTPRGEAAAPRRDRSSGSSRWPARPPP
jgi:antitoxin HigA-1